MRLDLGSAVLDLDRSGDGPVVVQAHGMTSSRSADAELGLDLAALGAAHTLVRYDARGHGLSTGRPVPDDYTWPSLASDLLRVVEECGDGGPVDVVGASMGAATILHAALRQPEAFRRLVLVVTPTAWEMRAAQGGIYEAGAAAIEELGLDAFLAATADAPAPPVLAERGIVTTPQVGGELLPSVLRGAARSDLPTPAELAALPHPVLLLPWAGDPGHPVATAEVLAATLPDARMHVAETAADVDTWPSRIAEFLAA